MPSVNDQEGSKVPAGLPPVVDAHVHVFPGSIFSAIWKWFDENAWSIRYRMASYRVFEFLLSRGIKHIVAFQVAHKPGVEDKLKNVCPKYYENLRILLICVIKRIDHKLR